MPAGCEFVCKNEKCSCYNAGFVITAPWALGKIELVIRSSQVSENKQFQTELKQKMKDGKTLTCIAYPNIDKIPTEGYRVQMWSPEAKCIWEYHTKELPEKNNKTCNGEIPEKCPKTGCTLLSFYEVTEEGILCPHCNEKLLQNRWYSKD